MSDRPLTAIEQRILSNMAAPTSKEGRNLPRGTPATANPAQPKGSGAKKAAQTPRNGPRKAASPPKAPKATPEAPRGVRVDIADAPPPNLNSPYLSPDQSRNPSIAEDAHKHPEATPCRVCGGQVPPKGGGSWGPWREHTDCHQIVGMNGLLVQAAAGVLGIAVLTREDAMLIKWTVPTYAATGADTIYPKGMKTRDRMAWRHLDRKALVQAIARIPDLRIEHGLDPSRCETGPCGVCGVVEARGWVEVDLAWADGSPAPLCGDCYGPYVRRGEPTFSGDLGPVVVEAMTGIAPYEGEYIPSAVVPYLLSDGAPGERWSHLPAAVVDGYRWAVWVKQPDHAPAEHRAEAKARRAEQERERAEATAALAAAEREKMEAGFGF